MAVGGPLPGNDAFIGKMRLMVERAQNPGPVVAATLSSFHKIEAARFTSEGPGWPELADNTLYDKDLLGFGDTGILVRTGDLLDSLTGGGEFSQVDIAPRGWSSISTTAYGGFHQAGAGNNPKRVLVDLNAETLTLWTEMYLHYVTMDVAEEMSSGQIAGVL